VREGVSFDGGQTTHPAAHVRLSVENELGRNGAHGVEMLVTEIENLALSPDFTTPSP
jgi:hypothetical protein